MPETFSQWIWFAFYTVGAFGGWWVAVILGGELVTRLKYLRLRRKGP